MLCVYSFSVCFGCVVTNDVSRESSFAYSTSQMSQLNIVCVRVFFTVLDVTAFLQIRNVVSTLVGVFVSL